MRLHKLESLCQPCKYIFSRDIRMDKLAFDIGLKFCPRLLRVMHILRGAAQDRENKSKQGSDAAQLYMSFPRPQTRFVCQPLQELPDAWLAESEKGLIDAGSHRIAHQVADLDP